MNGKFIFKFLNSFSSVNPNLMYTVKMVRILFIHLLFCILLSGCGQIPKAPPTETPIPPTALLATKTSSITITATITLSPTTTQTPTPMSSPTPVTLAAVADIAICGQESDDQTAALISDWNADIIIAGDANNEDGTLWQYQNCFQPSWGQYLSRIHPVAGNHDYYNDPIGNYYFYFGERAGEPDKGYYSFDLGDWHIVGLNSNCGFLPCGPSSDQVAWLKEDLSKTQKECTLAFWHVPRWNSGPAKHANWVQSFWDVLYDAGADVVVNGHDHHYERTGKIDAKGLPDKQNGIVEFIVGTGGAGHYYLETPFPFSEKMIFGEFGVLKLVLEPQSYLWQFINIEGEVLDEGKNVCH
ncbi:MAG: alkaline phosphatase [Chloroflexi bacterium HGW-Chloroflexi-8]|nr:MAG: alkaline phosphatase [Chloroflexi bacterium HGW-Chloroflexi-8]